MTSDAGAAATLPRAVLADPRAVAARWPAPRVRALAALAVTVTETPWRPLRELAELPREALVHAVALIAYFGHLNRIADAVGVPLDYEVAARPPPAEPATPALEPAPSSAAISLDLDARPATRDAIAAWQTYVMEREAPLDRRQRALIARRVAALLGQQVDGPSPSSELDATLLALADRVTLAPWSLDAAAYSPLRAAGFDDAGIFDTVVVASTAGVPARIAVALAPR